VSEDELIGIRAAVVPDGHRLAAPYELRAADAEMFPSPLREIARLAVGRPVPSFHRQHAEAIPDAPVVQFERLRERRRLRRIERLVEGDRRAAGGEMFSESVRGLQ